MQKVLIISYFFPPGRLVGSERTEYWAKNLYKYGYYPIILTRQWNPNQIELTDKINNNNKEHLIYDHYEVYKVPYKRSLRDILSNYKSLILLQKALTYLESILSNFFISALPFSNFQKKAEVILNKNQEINHVINSVAPFSALSISFHLKKKFSKINFIADYRDEWTTRTTNTPNSFLENILFHLDSKSEKKWTSNIDFFITVSETWKKSISDLINKNGFVIKNGHNFKGLKISKTIKNGNKLRIIYPGTLFSYQRIEIFISAVKKVHDKNSNVIQVDFYGVEVNKKELRRLKQLTKGYEDVFIIHNKLNKVELAKELQISDIGLITDYENLKGCLPVKIFDYYYFGLTILLCPSDFDEMEEFIKKTNTGFSVNSEKECYNKLMKLVKQKQQNKLAVLNQNKELLTHYSREHQTYLLSELLNKHKVDS